MGLFKIEAACSIFPDRQNLIGIGIVIIAATLRQTNVGNGVGAGGKGCVLGRLLFFHNVESHRAVLIVLGDPCESQIILIFLKGLVCDIKNLSVADELAVFYGYRIGFICKGQCAGAVSMDGQNRCDFIGSVVVMFVIFGVFAKDKIVAKHPIGLRRWDDRVVVPDGRFCEGSRQVKGEQSELFFFQFGLFVKQNAVNFVLQIRFFFRVDGGCQLDKRGDCGITQFSHHLGVHIFQSSGKIALGVVLSGDGVNVAQRQGDKHCDHYGAGYGNDPNLGNELSQSNHQENKGNDCHHPHGVNSLLGQTVVVDVHYQLCYGGADEDQCAKAKNGGQKLQNSGLIFLAPANKYADGNNAHEVDDRNGAKLKEALPGIFGVAEALRQDAGEAGNEVFPLGNKEYDIQENNGQSRNNGGNLRQNPDFLVEGVAFLCGEFVLENTLAGGGVKAVAVHSQGKGTANAHKPLNAVVRVEGENAVEDLQEAFIVGQKGEYQGCGDHGNGDADDDFKDKAGAFVGGFTGKSRENGNKGAEGEYEQSLAIVDVNVVGKTVFDPVAKGSIDQKGVACQAVGAAEEEKESALCQQKCKAEDQGRNAAENEGKTQLNLFCPQDDKSCDEQRKNQDYASQRVLPNGNGVAEEKGQDQTQPGENRIYFAVLGGFVIGIHKVISFFSREHIPKYLQFCSPAPCRWRPEWKTEWLLLCCF